MSGLLEGHIAAVTGAASGIGQAIAQRYAKEGARVAILDSNADGAAATAKAIEGSGGQAWSFHLDVTDAGACRTTAARIAADIGPVSVLVNNAGINRRNPFAGDKAAVVKDWQDIIAINLNGVFNVTHAFIDQLRATKGRIINIASIQAFVHVRTPNSAAYTTSKHGVLGFTRALAAELGKDGVRVNAIGPGPDRDAAQSAGARQQSGAGEDLRRPHAARPRRQARGHRRPSRVSRLRSVGLRHRLDRHGGRRLPRDLAGIAPCDHPSPRSRGEGRGEGQKQIPALGLVAAPHPSPLPICPANMGRGDSAP